MQLNNCKTKRLEYEAREKAIRHHNQMIFEAEQRGRKQKELEIIFSMYQRGISINQISSIVKINVDELEKILSKA